MKKIVSAYVNFPLILRIAIGLVVGIVLGLLLPEDSFVSVFGEIFVGALKAIAPLLVFVLVIASLSKAGKGIGKRFGTLIFFYMVSTFLAAAVAVIATFIFPITITLAEGTTNSAPSGLGEVFRLLLGDRKSVV